MSKVEATHFANSLFLNDLTPNSIFIKSRLIDWISPDYWQFEINKRIFQILPQNSESSNSQIIRISETYFLTFYKNLT